MAIKSSAFTPVTVSALGSSNQHTNQLFFSGALTKQQYAEMKRLKRQNKRKFKDQRVGTMLKETQMLLKRFYGPFDDKLCKHCFCSWKFKPAYKSTKQHSYFSYMSASL
jgi:hypothetical protein